VNDCTATRWNADFLSDEKLRSLGFKRIGCSVRIHPSCVLIGCERIEIGDHVRIDPFCLISAGESINIGDYVHIAANCSLTGSECINIGPFVGISHGARVFSASDDYSADAVLSPNVPDDVRSVIKAPVTLEEHSCVGAGTVLLPGATLRAGSTVGALSLVRGTLEPWTVYAGIPAVPRAKRNGAVVLAKAADVRRRDAPR